MTELIESNPEILGGKPIIKGTRIPLDLIFELVGCKIPTNEILEDYPSLKRDILLKIIEIGKEAKNHLKNINIDEYISNEARL
ncbi:MAG: DUF433 domain-containing protein [Promethearchaeota archaeon]